MLGDTNGDFKRKILGKTEEKVRGYRSVALSHYCGNGYAFCVMISRKLGLGDPPFAHKSGVADRPACPVKDKKPRVGFWDLAHTLNSRLLAARSEKNDVGGAIMVTWTPK